jgi:catechol 2,3-dioxygenase-like lactoylglutathione lyase family enzyme
VKLVQARIVTPNVARLAGFYADLLDAPTVLNDYYVEVPSGAVTVGFSKDRYTEFRGPCDASPYVLDFLVDGPVDEQVERIDRLGVEWVLPPTTQPWGTRSTVFRDPEGHLINVFSRLPEGTS